MEMNSKEDQKNRVVVALCVLLVISLFVNVVLVWQSVMSAPGFRIAAGDAERGEIAFQELKCVGCHIVRGVDDFEIEPNEDGLVVALGGEVLRVKTYGELITAIIHPSESIRPDVLRQYDMPDGKSLMPDYSTAMTTQQLMDIATFLEQHYDVRVPEYPTSYSPYGP